MCFHLSHMRHNGSRREEVVIPQRLRHLARLRRVRDRIDREYAQPLDVEALARGAHMSAGHLSREFRLAYGESPYSYLMTRRIERAMPLLQSTETGPDVRGSAEAIIMIVAGRTTALAELEGPGQPELASRFR
jgi:AraC-like DNA-binding protein